MKPTPLALRGLFIALTMTVISPFLQAQVTATSADLAKISKIEYAERLFSERKMYARGNAEKIAAAQTDLDKTWKETGWTREQFEEVKEPIYSKLSTMRSFKNGEFSADEYKEMMSDVDSNTLALLTKFMEQEDQTNIGDLVSKQVRDEIAAEKAGEPPTVAQLTGTWVVDAKASFEAIMGSPDAATPEMIADFNKKMGKTAYIFGPGDKIVTRAPRPDGTVREDIGTYRLEGRKVWFKSPTETKERSLDISMRKGKLQFGTGFGTIVFIKQ